MLGEIRHALLYFVSSTFVKVDCQNMKWCLIMKIRPK